jgi:hypothetical protein
LTGVPPNFPNGITMRGSRFGAGGFALEPVRRFGGFCFAGAHPSRAGIISSLPRVGFDSGIGAEYILHSVVILSEHVSWLLSSNDEFTAFLLDGLVFVLPKAHQRKREARV